MTDREEPHGALADALRQCLAVERWVREVVARAPFATTEQVLHAARGAFPLSDAEFEQALLTHPRIGERRPSGLPEQSEREQAAVSRASESIRQAIADGNRSYEERFGRIFLIRAAERTPELILAELQRRLALDDAADRRIAAAELEEITVLRVGALTPSVI